MLNQEQLKDRITSAVGCNDAVEASLKSVRAARTKADGSNNPSIKAALQRAERSLIEARGEARAHHHRLVTKAQRLEQANG